MYLTQRLILRGFDPTRDANTWVQLSNNVELLDLASSGPRIPTTTAAVKAQLEKSSGANGTAKLPRFAICLKGAAPDTEWPNNLSPGDDYYATAPVAIGFVGLQDRDFDFKNRVASVGISLLNPEHRNQGFGTEVLEWLLQYAFEELALHKLDLQVYENNPRAQRCYLKAGFIEEGRRRKEAWINGRWWDIIEMGVLEEDYFEKKRAKQATSSS